MLVNLLLRSHKNICQEILFLYMRQEFRNGIYIDRTEYEGKVGDSGFQDDFESWCQRNEGDFKFYSDTAYECQFNGAQLKMVRGSLEGQSRHKKFVTNSNSPYDIEGEDLIVGNPLSDDNKAQRISVDWI